MQKIVPERDRFSVPTLRDLGSGISVPVSVSAAWRPCFGYVLAAVSVTAPAGFRYKSGKLVPVTVKMVPVTPRTHLGVKGLSLKISGLGFWVWGLGFRNEGVGFLIQGSGKSVELAIWV